MTQDEFRDWWAAYKLAFPDTRNYVRKLGQEDGQGLLNQWQRALSDVELNDALAATDAIARGDADPPEGYSRDTTAAVVRKIAHRLRDARLKPERSEQDQERYRRPKNYLPAATGSLRKACERMSELQLPPDKGGESLTNSQAFSRVQLEMPEAFPPNDENRMPRYRCPRCRDTGTCMVWTGKAYDLARQNQLTGRESSLVASMLCDCRLGERSEENRRRYARFNERNHCECRGGDTTSEENRAQLACWLDTQTERMPNYEPSFAAYNQT